jgi:uncharacterized protein YegJ (DUF2314 family)
MIGNIGGICAKHSKERKKQWQKENKTLIIKKDDWVKIEVADYSNNETVNEHMWIIVTKIFKKERGTDDYFGKIDNIPDNLRDWNCGDSIKFKRSDIEQYIPKEEF